MSTGSELVCLRGGPTVPAEPLLLVFDLESRGFRLTADGDGVIVRPSSKLTPVDCDQIRRWKHHVIALLNYQAPEVG